MDIIFILLINLFCSLFLLTKATSNVNICTSPKCTLQSNLFYKDNKTLTIHFPTYGDLAVKSISYNTRRLDLIDPKNCVHEVFLNLNLSLTPFRYYYVLKEYKYINCSAKLETSSFAQVPCLSGATHHVYVVEAFSPVPGSCNTVKTVAIPFSYSPYLSDNSFGLGLTWEKEEESSKRRLEKYFKVSGIMALIFMAGIVFYATIIHYNSKELNDEKVKGTLIWEVDIDKLLGEYETLNCAKEVKAAPDRGCGV